MLPLLLRLEVQARETAQVLAAHGLVHRRAAPDALAVVVRLRTATDVSSHPPTLYRKSSQKGKL